MLACCPELHCLLSATCAPSPSAYLQPFRPQLTPVQGKLVLQQASSQQELLQGHCMFHPDWSTITRGLAQTNPDICAPSAAELRLLGQHKGLAVNDRFVKSRGSDGWCVANQTLVIIDLGQGSRAQPGFLGNHSTDEAIKETPRNQ
ncbi:hypothetical protein AOLI_G00050950 [Acnodon oligacanthus]